MSDATPSRPGQIGAAGAVDALWLKIFAGEVLTAYDVAKKLKPTVRVRTIDSGKSACNWADYKTLLIAGTPLWGNPQPSLC